MLYCLECKCAFNYSSGVEAGDYCPHKECRCIIEDIDEIYLPIIILLNDKEYFTQYCCSGHFLEGPSSPYIKFYPAVKKDMLANLPAGYSIEEHYDEDDDKYYVIRAGIKSKDMVERHKEILTLASELLDWANDLPELEEIDCCFVGVKEGDVQELKNQLESKYEMDFIITNKVENYYTIIATRNIPAQSYESIKLEMTQLAVDNGCKYSIRVKE